MVNGQCIWIQLGYLYTEVDRVNWIGYISNERAIHWRSSTTLTIKQTFEDEEEKKTENIEKSSERLGGGGGGNGGKEKEMQVFHRIKLRLFLLFPPVKEQIVNSNNNRQIYKQ